MAPFQKILIPLVAVAMMSCNRSAPKDIALPSNKPKQSGQWILESYDADKGFTFSKDGVLYATRCDHISSKVSNIRIDIQDQSQCARVLSYLHKTIPIDESSEMVNGVIAYVDGNDLLVFEILHAK